MAVIERPPDAAPEPAPLDEQLEEVWRDRPGIIGFLTTVDHKRIGLRYVVTAFVFFFLAGSEALGMRSQLATANETLVSANAYNDLFTLHGTTMIFLFNTPVLAGFGNYLLPLQIGARDMAFPRLNAFGYWCFVFSGIFLYSSVLVGSAPNAGWFAYAPLNESTYSKGLGLDFWALAVIFVGISSTTGAINFIVTTFKYRAPGMTVNRLPLFVWSLLAMAFMILFAFPSLTLATALLEADRRAGTAFYDTTRGGSALLYQHLFWFWGHPEVYILLLPAIGMMSMIIPVFSRRRLSGYIWVVSALVAIAFISFGVWIHHMFATGLPGAGPVVLLGRQPHHRHPQRHPVLLLDRHHVGIAGAMEDAHAVLDGLHAHLPHRRPVGRDGGGPAVRHPGHRQLLHRRPLPLRAQRGRGVPGVRRRLLLVPQGHRAAHERAAGAMELLDHARGLQRHVLPHAPARAVGHAAAGLHLPGRPGLGHGQHRRHRGRVPLRLRHAADRRQRLLVAPPRRDRRARPVAGRQPGMGDAVAHPGVELHRDPPGERTPPSVGRSGRAGPRRSGGRRRRAGCDDHERGAGPTLVPDVDTELDARVVAAFGSDGALARQTPVTSGLATSPEGVLRIPQPSYAPFVAGLGTAAFFCGLLVWTGLVVVVGIIVVLAGVARWTWRTEADLV